MMRLSMTPVTNPKWPVHSALCMIDSLARAYWKGIFNLIKVWLTCGVCDIVGILKKCSGNSPNNGGFHLLRWPIEGAGILLRLNLLTDKLAWLAGGVDCRVDMNSWNTESSSADVFNVGSEGLVAAGLFICGENKHADVGCRDWMPHSRKFY